MSARGWLAVVIVGAMVAPVLWCLIDAARHPRPSWNEAGRSKPGWIALLALGTVAIFVGLMVAFVYAASVRPAIRRGASPADASPSSAR